MSRKNFAIYFSFALLLMLSVKFFFLEDGLSWIIGGLKPVLYVLIIIYLINPLVNFIERHTKMNRTICVASAFIIVILIIAGFVSLIVPSLVDSIRTISNNLPKNNEQFLEIVSKLPVITYFIDTSSLSAFLTAMGDYLRSVGDYVMNYSFEIITSVKDFLKAFFILILSAIMAFHALKGHDNIGDAIEDASRAFLPDKFGDHFFHIMKLFDNSFKKFLIGKLYTCFILGIIVTLLILLINLISPAGIKIPYAPLIGFIIGITNIIPYIGPLLGTIPCLFLTVLAGFWEAVVLLIIILGAQQIDNIIVSPKILGSSVGLKPFWVILAVTIGGSLFGAIGMVLFVPLTAVLLKLATERIEAYKKR